MFSRIIDQDWLEGIRLIAGDLYGDRFSGVFSHPSFGFDLLLGKLFSETEAGLFGLITGVSMKYLVYFTILGGMISVLNLGRIIANGDIRGVFVPDGPGHRANSHR